MTYPDLCVMLLTCNRFAYAAQTIASFVEKASYSGKLLLHIADDGSFPGHTQRLVELAERSRFEGITVSDSGGQGYGANYNLGLQTVHAVASFILPLEDDWELMQEFSFDLILDALLESDGQAGCVRLGYIGFTQSLRGEVISLAGAHYLKFDPTSPEPHVWAGHPRIESREWQRKVGPWPEGVDPGTTEFQVAERAESRDGVLWPLSFVKPAGDLFAHIGTEQARQDQSAPSEAVTAESER